jgi:hypothetical protein
VRKEAIEGKWRASKIVDENSKLTGKIASLLNLKILEIMQKT